MSENVFQKIAEAQAEKIQLMQDLIDALTKKTETQAEIIKKQQELLDRQDKLLSEKADQ